MKTKPKTDGVLVTMRLRRAEYDAMVRICRERGQSRTDFLRAALTIADAVPLTRTRPLTGIARTRHRNRLQRERRRKRRGKA